MVYRSLLTVGVAILASALAGGCTRGDQSGGSASPNATQAPSVASTPDISLGLPDRILRSADAGKPSLDSSASARAPHSVDGVAIGPAASGLPKEYPGPCVPPGPPPTAYRVEGAAEGPAEVALGPDLDHDKIKDIAVTAPEYCSALGNCVYALYTRRGSCGHYVGIVSGESERTKTLASINKGLSDVEIELNWKGSSPPTIAFVHYRFNGQMYVGETLKVCTYSAKAMDSLNEPDVCEPARSLKGIALPPSGWPRSDEQAK